MSQLQDLIIGRFIARPDAVALQSNSGAWSPFRQDKNDKNSALIPWNRQLLQDHLDGRITAGHYMLSLLSEVRLITFDIDWDDVGFLPIGYDDNGAVSGWQVEAKLRDEWHDRASIHRTWMKTQLRLVSHKIAAVMFQELDIPVAIAYSGNKGVHVYGFTDVMPAEDARIGAEIVLKAVNSVDGEGANFQPSRGSFEWKDTNENLEFSFGNMTIEVFPKQDEISGDGFGNLIAMPLGINRKNPEDPKFFIDVKAPLSEMVPLDPIVALSTTNPWE